MSIQENGLESKNRSTAGSPRGLDQEWDGCEVPELNLSLSPLPVYVTLVVSVFQLYLFHFQQPPRTSVSASHLHKGEAVSDAQICPGQ